MARDSDAHPDDLMTTGEAARVLGLSPDMVRWLEREGRLPAQRTTTGVRLFRRGAVEQCAADRAAQSQRSGASGTTQETLPASDEEDA